MVQEPTVGNLAGNPICPTVWYNFAYILSTNFPLGEMVYGRGPLGGIYSNILYPASRVNLYQLQRLVPGCI